MSIKSNHVLYFFPALLFLEALFVASLAGADPASVGIESWCLANIDEIVAQAIAQKDFPGCVVCIGRRDTIVYHKAYGYEQFQHPCRPMAINMMFDIASITKPVATATSIMLLAQQGMLWLDDPVSAYIPEFTGKGKEHITIRDVLLHQNSFTRDNSVTDYQYGYEEAIQRICTLPALSIKAPSSSSPCIYVDVNYILLGEIIQRVTGKSLDTFARESIFQPLGMNETLFLPALCLRERIAPSGRSGNRLLRGEVHDSKAHLMGGICGHAGLFSTAHDLAVYAQMMLNYGACSGNRDARILKPETVALMTCDYKSSNAIRSLGWDKKSEHSTNRAEKLSKRAYGHGGFTGVAIWIDPELDLFYIVLTNRDTAKPKEKVYKIIARIGDCAVQALSEPWPFFKQGKKRVSDLTIMPIFPTL